MGRENDRKEGCYNFHNRLLSCRKHLAIFCLENVYFILLREQKNCENIFFLNFCKSRLKNIFNSKTLFKNETFFWLVRILDKMWNFLGSIITLLMWNHKNCNFLRLKRFHILPSILTNWILFAQVRHDV